MGKLPGRHAPYAYKWLLCWASPDAERRCREQLRLAIGHLLGHVKKQATVAFFNLAQQTAKTPKVTRVLAGAAPCDIVRALPLRKIRQLGRFFAVVEELVERDFHRPGQLFERLDRRDGVSVFDARDVAAEQTGALFNVALGKFFGFS